MKTKLILLATIAIGTAAVAQETNPMPSSPAVTADTAPPPSEAAAPVAPAAPADAIPAPATPPVATDANAQAVPAPAEAASYPACSRTVTDQCTQMNERRRARPR
jgi:hypothetical protein